MRRPTRQAALGAAALLALCASVALAGTAAAVAASVDRSTVLGTSRSSTGDVAAGADTASGTDDTAAGDPVRVRELRDGDVAVTEDELRVAAPDASEGWIQTMLITARCMTGKGFHLDPRIPMNPPGYSGSAAERAETGATGTGSEYRWQDAGCWGYAVHVMGDDLNR